MNPLEQLQKEGREAFHGWKRLLNEFSLPEERPDREGNIAENWLNSLTQKAFLAGIEAARGVVDTHDEGDNMGYCDTGADMEYACRSECVEMAQKRIQSLLANKGV